MQSKETSDLLKTGLAKQRTRARTVKAVLARIHQLY